MADGTNFSGLLGDAFANPLLQTGLGLLAAGGPSLVPVSTGQALARGVGQASEAQRGALQNQLVRSRLTEESRRRAAQDRLRGLLTSEGDERMGLLADIAPEEFVRGLLTPSAALDPLQQAQLAKIMFEVDALGKDRRTQEAGAAAGVKGAINDVKSIADANDTLEKSTLLAPGTPGREAARTALSTSAAVKRFLGIDASEEEGAIAAEDTFKKSSASLVTRLQQQATQAGLSDSVAQLQNIQAQMANPQISAPANRRILISTLDGLLAEAGRKGVALEVRGEYETLLKRLKDADIAFRKRQAEAPDTSTAITPQPGVPQRTATTPATTPAAIPLPANAAAKDMRRNQRYTLPDGSVGVWDGSGLRLVE